MSKKERDELQKKLKLEDERHEYNWNILQERNLKYYEELSASQKRVDELRDDLWKESQCKDECNLKQELSALKKEAELGNIPLLEWLIINKHVKVEDINEKHNR